MSRTEAAKLGLCHLWEILGDEAGIRKLRLLRAGADLAIARALRRRPSGWQPVINYDQLHNFVAAGRLGSGAA